MQDKTPEPASKEVFFTYEGPVTKYVKQFGGRAQVCPLLASMVFVVDVRAVRATTLVHTARTSCQ